MLKKLINLPPTVKLYLDYGKLAVIINSDIQKISFGASYCPAFVVRKLKTAKKKPILGQKPNFWNFFIHSNFG